jgi:hypothetical protein
MFRFEDKLQEGSFAVAGEGYRGWVTDGRKRLRVIISRELLKNLAYPDRPENALERYSRPILALVGEKWAAGFAEEGDAGHYVLIVPNDADRIRTIGQ